MERLADLAQHTRATDWARLAAKYKLVPDGYEAPLHVDELQPLVFTKPREALRRETQQYDEELGIWTAME